MTIVKNHGLICFFNGCICLHFCYSVVEAGISFGMMFGSRPSAEEWSSDDEDDDDDEDEEIDDDDDESDDDEESDDDDDASDDDYYEAPAKNYSNMNLKEAIRLERESKLLNEGETEAEAKRKLKNAKKRAEKRRKQKEKKVREAAMKEEEEGQKTSQARMDAIKQDEEVQRLKEAKIKQRLELLDVLRSGNLSNVKSFIGDTLDPKNVNPGDAAMLQRRSVMRELICTHPVLHCCVAETPAGATIINDDFDESNDGRLEVVRYLLRLKTFPVNLMAVDDDGRTALHLACKKSDSSFVKVFLESPKRRAQIDLNMKCNKTGGTPLHYAAGQGDILTVRQLMDAGNFLLFSGLTFIID